MRRQLGGVRDDRDRGALATVPCPRVQTITVMIMMMIMMMIMVMIMVMMTSIARVLDIQLTAALGVTQLS